MPLNAERQVSVVPLIKIAAAFSWLHRSLPGVRGRAQILQFYGKNNKSLKQAIPGNYGHEPTLMTPSSANITTEVDLLTHHPSWRSSARKATAQARLSSLHPLAFFFTGSDLMLKIRTLMHNCSPPNRRFITPQSYCVCWPTTWAREFILRGTLLYH